MFLAFPAFPLGYNYWKCFFFAVRCYLGFVNVCFVQVYAIIRSLNSSSSPWSIKAFTLLEAQKLLRLILSLFYQTIFLLFPARFGNTVRLYLSNLRHSIYVSQFIYWAVEMCIARASIKKEGWETLFCISKNKTCWPHTEEASRNVLGCS